MMDMLVTNFYVLMVGQIEILKQEFKLLIEETDSFCQYSPNNAIKTVVNKEQICETKNFTHQEQKTYIGSSVSKNDFDQKILNYRLIRCMKHYDAIVKYSQYFHFTLFRIYFNNFLMFHYFSVSLMM